MGLNMLLCLSWLLLLFAVGVSGFNFTDSDSSSLDGCRYVYLDVGSNMGMHTRFLFEPEKYSRSKYSAVIFDKYFMKDRKRKDICAFGFEPNDAQVPRLDHLTKHFHKQGLRVNFFHGAVSNVTSTATFYSKPKDTVGVGFSGFDREKGSVAFTVHTINLSEFILNKIAKRKIPSPLYPNDPPPAVIMKMDIEGYEHVVLPMMMESKALCELDILTIEYHEHRPGFNIPRGSDAKLQEKLQAEVAKGCKVKILKFDDESYYNDTAEGLADLAGL